MRAIHSSGTPTRHSVRVRISKRRSRRAYLQRDDKSRISGRWRWILRSSIFPRSKRSIRRKRPFFVQGSNAFDFGGSLLLLSQRVVARCILLPAYRACSSTWGLRDGQAAYADVPDASTILGAAKLTGRVGASSTVGILDAVTNAERAQNCRHAWAAPHTTQLVEPLTNYLVARGKRDFRGGATTVGRNRDIGRFDDSTTRSPPSVAEQCQHVGGDISDSTSRPNQ